MLVEIVMTESSETLHHQGVDELEPIEQHRTSHPQSATSHHSQEQVRAQLIPNNRP